MKGVVMKQKSNWIICDKKTKNILATILFDERDYKTLYPMIVALCKIYKENHDVDKLISQLHELQDSVDALGIDFEIQNYRTTTLCLI